MPGTIQYYSYGTNLYRQSWTKISVQVLLQKNDLKYYHGNVFILGIKFSISALRSFVTLDPRFTPRVVAVTSKVSDQFMKVWD